MQKAKTKVTDLIQAFEAVKFEDMEFPLVHVVKTRIFDDPWFLERMAQAPASTKVGYHHAYDGGWCDHVLDMWDMLKVQPAILGLTRLAENSPIWMHGRQVVATELEMFLACLMHDFHKLGDCSVKTAFYLPKMVKASRRKDETQMVQAERQPYEVNKDVWGFLQGGGKESPARSLLHLMREHLAGGDLSLALVCALHEDMESMLSGRLKHAIRFSDGLYGENSRALRNRETMLQIMVHHVDFISAHKSKAEGGEGD